MILHFIHTKKFISFAIIIYVCVCAVPVDASTFRSKIFDSSRREQQ